MSNKNRNFMEELAKELEMNKNAETSIDSSNKQKIEEKPKPKLEDVKESKDKSPDSFNKETFTRIEKEKIKLNPKVIIGAVIALIAVGILSYFFFFAPKIVMPDFMGENLTELTTWASQYEIDKTGIVINKEYSFEFDEGIIMSQSINPGSKVKKDVKLTIVASDGADPDEIVSFPDIKNMNIDEIKDWIKENKLSKTKVVTEYSTTVEKDMVIKYDLKNVNENNFTRGTNLNITVSKGEAPAGQITVEEFTNKTYEEMKVWANSKKVTLEKTEGYSDTIVAGNVISQSVKSGTALKEGEVIKVVVSKGKSVKIPNLVGYTPTMLEAWSAAPDSKVTVVKKEVYNSAPYGNVIDQSIAAGSLVDQGSVLELTISIYLPVLQTSSDAWYGKNYMELIAKVDEWNYRGANIAAGPWIAGEYSNLENGAILEYVCADANGNELPGNSQYSRGCERPLPLDAKIGMKVSLGKYSSSEPDPVPTIDPPKVLSKLEKKQQEIVIRTSPKANVSISLLGDELKNPDSKKASDDGLARFENVDLTNVNLITVKVELDGATNYVDLNVLND
ncbi:MAG: PASTA domain-containing protein [Erysipelotrichaceae bacterium]|nr:PASTA domain-containing protein [Erysipelotrichaceae bacterium]